ncbi:MAG: undecaprenyldiphospho-muramoylpentapeptide beta-N-acetylglucosaminyltransferase [Peptostreptococcaceae bacterium]|nr:undecaprenyldiphospho-muramoylpentapeptide beta-N-acetylglucosaminyltransferase [Peptostreptococcaceae bacterium]
MKVLMTGGGTGGHIYPAIAIADRIKKEHKDAEILFVGTERGLEKSIVPKSGYNIKFIRVRGFNRKNVFKNIKVLLELPKAFKDAKNIIKAFNPDIVIGTGGYVCGPVVRIAHKLGVKTYIHEQNALPGLTNKLLEKYVDKIFIGFKEAEKNFRHKEKIVLSGNPVRSEFEHLDKSECRKKLGIPDKDFAILAFGGSGGAGTLNKEILNVIKTLNEHPEVSIFFGTGGVYYERVISELKAQGIRLSNKIKVLEYIENIQNYLGASDLVISRAGALTIAEITICGKASILIPSPNVTGNHQYFNAKAISETGGAILIQEKNLDEDRVMKAVEMLMADRCRLEKMETASKNCAHETATEIIYKTIMGDL